MLFRRGVLLEIYRMLEKRRHGSWIQLAALFLLMTVCLLLWKHSGCPGPPFFVAEPPGYLLILSENASSLPAPYDRHTLPPDDRARLIDLTDFRFLIKGQECNRSDPLVVVLVHSDPRNYDKREAIRNTWGSQLKVLFILGYEPTLQDRIKTENENHHDIVQGSFHDAYRNMTYKHVMALKWATYYCPGARYLLKTDDDVFVNPKALVHHLQHSLSPHGARRLILCQSYPYGYVRRSYRSKWRVSFSEYRGHLYPPYCQGWAVLYSPDVVFRLYREAQSANYFWIDDVFVTGLMAARANFGRCALGDLILSKERANALENKGPNGDFFIFGPPDISINDIYRLWQIVSNWDDQKMTSYQPTNAQSSG